VGGVAGPPSRVVINAVRPLTPDRVSAAKGAVGHALDISANVFADGHDLIAGRVRWRPADGQWVDVPMTALGNDRFTGRVHPPGRMSMPTWRREPASSKGNATVSRPPSAPRRHA